jgi:microcystin-dependent protein
MARNKLNAPNIDNSQPSLYPDGRIKDNTGANNGTPVNELVYGDLHEFFAKMMRDSGITYNNLPDNEANGYQLFEAMRKIASKSDLMKSVTQATVDTLSIPVNINALKEDEFMLFRAGLNSSSAFQFIKGNLGNATKNLVITGNFFLQDLVIVTNRISHVEISTVYSSDRVGNLNSRLVALENALVATNQKLAVFQAGGGMVLWNKPANQIPAGWAEVTNWRGRIPVGYDSLQTEFNLIGKQGGSKTKTLAVENMPAHSHKMFTNERRTVSPSSSANRLATENPDNYVAAACSGGGDNDYSLAKAGSGTPTAGNTQSRGNGIAFDVLNPYRVVMFIEWVGV